MKLFTCVMMFLSVGVSSGWNLKECDCPLKFVDVADENVPISICLHKIFILVNVEWAEIVPLKTDKQEDPDDQIRYTVDLKSILKGYDLLKGVDTRHIYALRDYHLCGTVMLNHNFSYILSVFVLDGKMYINRCSVVEHADFVTEVQRKIMGGQLSCPTQ